jgi:hypothetical protein
MDEARGPEDRIEQIVHEAEGGAQFEFNPAAWSAMEAKLDAVARVPFNWWKLLFPVAGTALLLTLLLWPIAASDLIERGGLATTESPAQEKQVEADQTENSNKTLSAKNDSDAERSNQNAGTTTAGKTESINSSSQSDNSNTGIIGDTDQSKQLADVNVVDQRLTADVDTNTAQGAVVTATDAGKQEAAQTTTRTNQTDIERFRAQVEKDIATVNNADKEPAISYFSLEKVDETKQEGEVTELSLQYQSDLILPEPELEPIVDSALYSEKSSEVQYFQKSRWAFSLALSADLSATGLEGFTDPGTMVGFGVEYYVSDKWSIQTGATLAVKKYTALGSEYATPDWISARPDDLLSASAVCTVIDIPINIRKYFQTRKGNTFFVSTGVSTYLMLREDYNYEYTEERPGWLPFWSFRNQNNHFFGILNLSVGYEKPLGKNFALGIEPFMKLPLTGIGEGRVRFLSFGTNIAIKLRK